MSDGFSKYVEELEEYMLLCNLLNQNPSIGQFGTEIDYDHFEYLKKLPCVKWTISGWTVNKRKCPEMFI
jgi:hypothetical protein